MQRTYFEELAAWDGGSLNVVIVCDSLHTGTTAMEIYDSFVAQFGDGFLFQRHLFDFHNIADSHSTERALHAAAVADVLIIASARKEFPAFIQEWLAALALVRADRSGAMIALVSHDAPLSVCAPLEYTARVGGLDFWRINLSCPVFSKGRPRCPWCFPWAVTNPVSETESSNP